MQISKSLMLVHLRHAEFLDEQLFNFFQLVDLFVLLVYFTVLLSDQILIILPLLIFYHALTF